jgi:hypothetical protein
LTLWLLKQVAGGLCRYRAHHVFAGNFHAITRGRLSITKQRHRRQIMPVERLIDKVMTHDRIILRIRVALGRADQFAVVGLRAGLFFIILGHLQDYGQEING